MLRNTHQGCHHSFLKMRLLKWFWRRDCQMFSTGFTQANRAVGEVGWIFMAISPNSTNTRLWHQSRLDVRRLHRRPAVLPFPRLPGKHEPSTRRDPSAALRGARGVRWPSLAGVVPGLPQSMRRLRFRALTGVVPDDLISHHEPPPDGNHAGAAFAYKVVCLRFCVVHNSNLQDANRAAVS
jgi:hypothetical protein